MLGCHHIATPLGQLDFLKGSWLLPRRNRLVTVMGRDDESSLRTLTLLPVGAFTTYVVLRHPELGAAIGVGVIVVALLHSLLGR